MSSFPLILVHGYLLVLAYWYHNPKRLENIHDKYSSSKAAWEFKNKYKEDSGIYIQEDLFGFLDAVLDEVRIKKANAFAYYALYISDNQDLAYFREAVAKRETSADINIDRQRDHAVHTLYNYLLGWYIFDNCGKLRTAFINHFRKLNIAIEESSREEKAFYKYDLYRNKVNINNDGFHKTITLVNEFGDVWSIASLLHDIGYILEGNLSSASPDVELERVHNGSKIIHDYFNHWFWKDYDVDFKAAQHIAKVLGIDVPDFKSSRSLASLGDHLRNIGNCENIREELRTYNDDIHRLYPLPFKMPYL